MGAETTVARRSRGRQAGARRLVGVTVSRSDPTSPTRFEVEVGSPVTVLDVLLGIQRAHDRTLAFRYSCRVAMCGTCALRVDGRSALACRSMIAPDVEEIALAPVSGLPVVRDLIVDTAPFWAQWRRVTPWFVPRSEPPDAPPDNGASPDAALGCIACGACYSTCELARAESDYLGPAALNRAFALVSDSRDGARAERLRAISGRGGVDRCHYVGACTSACPVGIDPAHSIRELRRLRLLAHV